MKKFLLAIIALTSLSSLASLSSLSANKAFAQEAIEDRLTLMCSNEDFKEFDGKSVYIEDSAIELGSKDEPNPSNPINISNSTSSDPKEIEPTPQLGNGNNLDEDGKSNQIEEQHLQELVVKGERPEIKSEDGVMVIDLAKIVKDKAVTNILESLGYLPGVMNNNGLIGLTGATSTTILINGEPSQMSVEQLYQLLYSLPIDRLKNVEVMYSAPAKYHVVGAVINVVLKTPSALDGLQGQGRIGYDKGYYASLGGGMSAVYAIDKWNFDLNYSFSDTHTYQGEDMVSLHSYQGEVYRIEDLNRSSKKNLANLIHTTIGYNLGNNSLIRLTYNGQIKGDVKADNRSTGTLGKYLNHSTFDGPIILHNVNLNYKSSFGLTLNADYLTYREKRTQLMSDLSTSSVLVNSNNTQRINRYRFTADMEHGLSGWTLGYGVSYHGSNDQSSMTYLIPDNPGFSNTLREHTAKVYMSLGHTFPCGLSVQTSFAEELYRRVGDQNTEIKITNKPNKPNNKSSSISLHESGDEQGVNPYQRVNSSSSSVLDLRTLEGLESQNPNKNNWIFSPQIGMTYFSNPKHILQLNFTTRRIYPAYWELHGGVGYVNPYTEVWGNPLLKPSTTYEGTLSYIFHQKYVATFFVNDIEDYAVQLPYQSPDQLKLIFQNINTNFNRKVGLVLVTPISVGEWLDTRFMFQGYYGREKADRFHDISFDRKKLTGYAMIQNTFKIIRCLSLTLDFSGITSSLQGIADIYGMWKVDAGAKWCFGKNSCCDLTVNASDIFNTWNPTLRIKYGNQNYHMDTRQFARNLRVTFVCRFNGFKPKDNQGEDDIDTSRFGTK